MSDNVDMDPEATLTSALERLSYRDFEGASRLLEDYRWWRRCGGAKPENGDSRHDQILQDLRVLSADFRLAGVLISRPTDNFEGVVFRK